jgi:hypothetical protein
MSGSEKGAGRKGVTITDIAAPWQPTVAALQHGRRAPPELASAFAPIRCAYRLCPERDCYSFFIEVVVTSTSNFTACKYAHSM